MRRSTLNPKSIKSTARVEGEIDEEHLEVLPVGDHVVVEELLAGVVALPLLDHLAQGVIICRIAVGWPLIKIDSVSF